MIYVSGFEIRTLCFLLLQNTEQNNFSISDVYIPTTYPMVSFDNAILYTLGYRASSSLHSDPASKLHISQQKENGPEIHVSDTQYHIADENEGGFQEGFWTTEL